MVNNSIFNPETKTQRLRYFSIDIKKKIVRDLEKNLHSVSDVCKTYQVSRTSVYRWIYKYSSMAKRDQKQVVEAKSDTKKIKALEQRIKELERIVGQKQLAIEFNEKMIEIAENRFNIEIKKKSVSKASSGLDSIDPSTASK
ncbi:MAG: transposase [Bacteroidetes bacterium]|nr:transposase [Bacteroidota bacterium]MBC36114.1 transposase [Bacteroidota bacterium]|tara:strand:+ start:165 stop:590 length:426 start_codon:yes stop_codon:yes gene_type:complete